MPEPGQPPELAEQPTLLAAANDPTNQQQTDSWTEYLSVRITIKASIFHDKVEELFGVDASSICYYVHKRGNDREHVHICYPTSDPKAAERLRLRIKRSLGCTGSNVGIKKYFNGAHGFMFYCGHDGGDLIFEDPHYEETLSGIDKYMIKHGKDKIDQHFQPVKVEDRKDRGWALTYMNIVKQAVNHRRRHHLTTTSLKEVVQDMLRYNWLPTKDLIRGGVPDFYQSHFEFQIGNRKAPDMSWFSCKFN